MPKKKEKKQKTPEKVEENTEEKATGKTEELSEDEALKQLQEAVNRMPVKDLIGSMLMNLSATAYVKMGLPEETNGKYKEIAEAKQAVDCMDALVKAIEPALEKDALDMYRQTVANLKMAYVRVK